MHVSKMKYILQSCIKCCIILCHKWSWTKDPLQTYTVPVRNNCMLLIIHINALEDSFSRTRKVGSETCCLSDAEVWPFGSLTESFLLN